jgi:hypothetical protein
VHCAVSDANRSDAGINKKSAEIAVFNSVLLYNLLLDFTVAGFKLFLAVANNIL